MTGKYSGERVHPGFTPGGLVEQHVAAYRFFLPHARGRNVLEVGCGEGFGTAMLAEVAGRVTSIDYSPDALREARRVGGEMSNLAFVGADAEVLPFRPASFGAVFSSQVLEHLRDQQRFLESVRSLLRADGVAVVVTPNRRQSLFNPFHLRELEAGEMRALLEAVFPQVRVLGIFPSARARKAIEERRRWPRRVLALDVLRLRERLPREAVVAMYGLAARTMYRGHRRWGSGVDEQLGEEDFFLAASPLDEALDLFGVCGLEAGSLTDWAGERQAEHRPG